MATVKAFIRVSSKKTDTAAVRFRFYDGRKVEISYRSDLLVRPELWDPAKQQIKAKAMMAPQERAKFNKAVTDLKALIIDLYNNAPAETKITSEWLRDAVDRAQHPEKYPEMQPKKEDFITAFATFTESRPVSEIRKRGFRVLQRDLQRFELYMQRIAGRPRFSLSFDSLTEETLREFDKFLREEHKYFTTDQESGATICAPEYAPIMEAVPETRTPERRGDNTIIDIFSKLSTFCRWARDTERTAKNPFKNYKIGVPVYGTPYFLTIEERNQLYKHDFSARPALGVQRDIFVFHCLIGCRIGDLYRLTKDNVINGAVEYIASKTQELRPVTVRVPLSQTAREILDKYQDFEGPGLLPFISEQKYRQAIKDMLRLAGIDRAVTIWNPTTSQPETRPIYEIASSHLARRTFVGNLYKQVKDPNLVGALSGHKEGSRAFARYRTIDEDMKKDLVKLLD